MRKPPRPRNHCLDCGGLCWQTRCRHCASMIFPPKTSIVGNDEAILRYRWARGDLVADIAIGLGKSRNAVIGKARRLGLGPHPRAKVKGKVVVMPRGPYLYETIGPHDCRWPIGHPNKPGFRFCGEPAIEGKPYCGRHCALAYQRPAKMAEAAD